MKSFIPLWIAAGLLLGFDQLHAQTIIDTDTVYDESCPGEIECGEPLVVIDGAETPTTLQIIAPGRLEIGESESEPSVRLQGSSILDVSGGYIGNHPLFDPDPVVRAYEQSSVIVSDGILTGSWGAVYAYDPTSVRVVGGLLSSRNDEGSTGTIILRDSATATISGGTIQSTVGWSVIARGNADFTITDGQFFGLIGAKDSGVADIFGGTFGGFTFGWLSAAGASEVNIYGGAFGPIEFVFPYKFDVQDGATLNIFGRNLTVDSNRLTGVLAEGTPLDVVLTGNVDNIVLHEVASALQPGDANQDLVFDTLDIVQVQQIAKYLTGEPATWGEGDWDAAPGGIPGAAPPGDGVFDQKDIVSSLQSGVYLTGPYGAIIARGEHNDPQTSFVYDPATGGLAIDAPSGTELTSINIDSAAGIFTGDAATNLGGSFDNDADNNIFKATFGSSFGSLSFGKVAQTGLSEEFVLNDLTVIGSLAGGADLGGMDLIYVPEPSSLELLFIGSLAAAACRLLGTQRYV